jgi:alpha-beta hydrolase superfamily lysophospholipase
MARSLILLAVGLAMSASAPLERGEVDRSLASPLAVPGVDRLASDSLPRRALFGAMLSPVPDTLARSLRLAPGAGALLGELTRGGTAAQSGLEPGDVLISLDGRPIADFPAFIAQLRALPVGRSFRVEIRRRGARSVRKLVMRERPRDEGERYTTHYDHVTVGGIRLRTMITEPRAPGRHPVLFILGGIGPYSVDGPLKQIPYHEILGDFVARDWVTVRLDKPGQGDSEGGPTIDADFDTELAAYEALLAALPGYAFVDTSRIYMLGHSMGGSFAALAAAGRAPGVPAPRGIAVYGTMGKSWPEYWLENARRQLTLAGTPPGEIHRTIHELARLTTYLIDDGEDPATVRAAHPELAATLDAFHGDGRLSGLTLGYWRQMARRNLGDAWARVPSRVLVLFGEHDFVASRGDHELIADIVNGAHEGAAVYKVIPGADHGMERVASLEESMRKKGGGPFDTAVLDALWSWISSTRKG